MKKIYKQKHFVVFLGLILMGTISAMATVVKGTVTDSNGEPLIGVSVRLVGNPNIGTITDMSGNYSINVPDVHKGVLNFSYVGMSPQNEKINDRTIVNVIMTEDSKVLDEVVVVGYGVQRKEAVTGSVVSMKGDIIREVPSSDITSALQGRIAGVQMTPNSSEPGASMRIRIRGSKSLTASNDPLIVLDGIPFGGSLNDIDPNSIKSLDILKDASASAIYGSRGANGVILITTKTGVYDTKATVSYHGYLGVKTIFHKYKMMNAEQFTKLREYSGKYAGQYGPDETPWGEEGAVDTDWQDLLYKNAITTNHELSVTGGTKSSSYNFGLSYHRDESVIPDNYFERYAFHAAIDQNIGKYLHLGFNSNTKYSINNGKGIGNNLAFSPLINPYNADGSLKLRVQEAIESRWVLTEENIENLGDSYKNQTRGFATYNNFYGEVKVPGAEGLKYRLNLGLNYIQTEDGYYKGQGVFDGRGTSNSTANVRNSNTINLVVENLLTYDKVFGKHNINTTALFSAEQTTWHKNYMEGEKIPNDAFQYYNIGQAGLITVAPDDQGYNRHALMSWMGRVMYNYDNRYMLSVAVRGDGSSRLAEGHKWHTYPSVSAGWNINKDFFKDLEWLNYWKLRVGYGQTSNQSVAPYSTLGSLGTIPYNFNTQTVMGYYVSTLPNPNLGWEYSHTWNFATDFYLFNNRLKGTFEYYIINTEDVLMGVKMPNTSGVDSYTANIGKTQNKGFEISLDGMILDNVNGWTWTAGINLYHNSNKIKALASGMDRDESNCWFVGHSINSIYDYNKIGLWQQDEEELREILEPGGNVGMIKVEYTGEYDENGKPVRAIGADDRKIIDTEPDFEGGFNTMVMYKNLDLQLVGTFRRGGLLVSGLYGTQNYRNTLTGKDNNLVVDYWTEENTDAKYPRPGGVGDDHPKYGTTLGYFDGSYLKIRTITLGYNFVGKWMTRAGISKLRLYTTVQNPFVLFSDYTKESGLDPEPNASGSNSSSVKSRVLMNNAGTPTTRNFIFGVNVVF